MESEKLVRGDGKIYNVLFCRRQSQNKDDVAILTSKEIAKSVARFFLPISNRIYINKNQLKIIYEM